MRTLTGGAPASGAAVDGVDALDFQQQIVAADIAVQAHQRRLPRATQPRQLWPQVFKVGGMADIQLQVFGVCRRARSEEHTSELQSLMRLSYAVFCLKNKRMKKY